MTKQANKQKKPIVTFLAALGVTILGIVILFLEDETAEYLMVLTVAVSLLFGGISFLIQGFQVKRYLAGIMGLAAYLLVGLALIFMQYFFSFITIAPCFLVGL